MGADALVFCERTGAWAVALGRLAGGDRFDVRQTRSVAECREVLGETRGGVLVLELTEANARSTLELVAELQVTARDMPVVVVADRRLEEHRLTVLELGAAAFVTSPRALRPVATLIEACFARLPKQEQTLAERLRARLPWKRAASPEWKPNAEKIDARTPCQ